MVNFFVFLQEMLLIVLLVMVVSNFVMGVLAAEKFDGATFVAGVYKVFKVLLFFIWLSAVEFYTRGFEIFGWTMAMLIIPLLGLFILYYFQSALKNGIQMTGAHFAILDQFDEALKKLFGKDIPGVVTGLNADEVSGEG